MNTTDTAAVTALVEEWRRRVRAIGRDTGSYRQCADELEALAAAAIPAAVSYGPVQVAQAETGVWNWDENGKPTITQVSEYVSYQDSAALREAAQALLVKLRRFADAPSDKVNDERWHFEVLPAMKSLEAALSPEGTL